ncbi:putative portal protein [Vibrio phage pVco-14]|nr:putative portal protein [Vibrio phage pVco-14]
MANKKRCHPSYTARFDSWQLCRDSYDGERAIKKRRDKYLPATSGMILDGFGKEGQIGEKAYQAMLTRAHYPEIFEEAVESAIGVMHRKEATIELPDNMLNLMERATSDGEDLQMLLRRINFEQLVSGRLGILGDLRVNKEGVTEPVVVIYRDKAVYNWDDRNRDDANSGLRMVALDESGYELQQDMQWKWVDRSRILAMIDPQTKMMVDFDEEGKLPDNAICGYLETTEDDDFVGKEFTPINAQGTEAPNVPFSFINTKDLSSETDKPPLEGLANLCLAIYRGEADFRQQLFMQGQDTLVRIGVQDTDAVVRTGAGTCLDVPLNGDAKYIGVSGQGLSEQAKNLEKDYNRAEAKTAKLMNTKGAESGDALNIRVAAQTATLPQIAKTGAAALQSVLRQLAVMLGENPDKVVIKPNLEFADKAPDASTLLGLVQSKAQGAPISDKSIHAYMQENGFTEMDYEAELAEISNEEPRI